MLTDHSTLAKKIQVVLNDNPLTAINLDIHELQPLTPSHPLFSFEVMPLPYPSLQTLGSQ